MKPSFIEVWFVAFPSRKRTVVLGGDYRLVLDGQGRRVRSLESPHGGITKVKVAPSVTRGEPVVLNHVHGPGTGDLPTATDLLRIYTSPYLRGLAVIGPRVAMLVGTGPDPPGWSGRLYRSEPFRRLIARPRPSRAHVTGR